jgi:hypothetical protein
MEITKDNEIKEIVLEIKKTETGDWLRSPLTNKAIKVGSQTYNKLVKAKILKIDPNELGRILYMGTSKEDCEKVIDKIPAKKDTVKTIRNNRIYQNPRKIKVKEMNKRIQDLTMLVYQQNKEKFNNEMTSEQVQSLIKKLVQEKLISEDNNDIPIRREIEYIVENSENAEELEEDCSSSEEEELEEDDE